MSRLGTGRGAGGARRAGLVALACVTVGLMATGGSADAEVRRTKPKSKKAAVIELDGARTEVRWSDGDSFKVLNGKHSGSGARLMGFNTLESFGPVHRWGEWTPWELYRQAKSAHEPAVEKVWKCTTAPQKDHYGRLLVHCPDLIVHMVEGGHAHLFFVDETPPADAVAAQRRAVEARRGIWAKGTPRTLVTSLHSVDEKGGGPKTYNRVADTATGVARKVEHSERYEACQQVCVEDSCMVYAPFDKRYGPERARCLRWPPTDGSDQPGMPGATPKPAAAPATAEPPTKAPTEPTAPAPPAAGPDAK